MEDEEYDFQTGLIIWVGHIIAPALAGFWLLDGYDVNDTSTLMNMIFGYGLLGYAAIRLIQIVTNLWMVASLDKSIKIKSSERDLSNAADKKSVTEELRGAKALLDDGIIDDDEFKQMKKDILDN